MSDNDPRLDLPGSSTAPVEGGPWMRIKIIVWGVAIVLVIALAALFARIATEVAGSAPKLSLPAVSVESLVRGDPDRRQEAREESDAEPSPEPTAAETVAENDAATAGAEDGPVTRPAWTIQPMADYPTEAARAGIEQGAVEMNCGVTVDGWLSDCRILSETPTGHGFADATLRSAQGARMRPRMTDAGPVETRVQYTTRYRLD